MELLIVVAVIVILAGILLPVLVSARKRAAVVRCQNNIRQLGISGLSYFFDNDIPSSVNVAQLAPREAGGYTPRGSDSPAANDLALACIIIVPPEIPSPCPDPPPPTGGPPGVPGDGSDGSDSDSGSDSGSDPGDGSDSESGDDEGAGSGDSEESGTGSDPGSGSGSGTVLPLPPGDGDEWTYEGPGSETGCPNSPVNPAYYTDPDNQPRYRSYGILKHNLGKPLIEAWPWLFSESDLNEIESSTDLAEYRHDGSVNVFFSDGHAEFLSVDSVVFPETPE